jgi:lipoate---protein ligase
MVTRGVASVRSPVKNLQEFCPTVAHDKFVRAMVQAFREEYRIDEPVRPRPKALSLDRPINPFFQVRYVGASEAVDIPYIRDGMAELPVKAGFFSL